MPEVSYSRADHCDPVLIGSRDDLVIADGTTWLNHGAYTNLYSLIDSIAKGEEGIAGHHTAFKGQLCFLGSELHGVDPAHLTGSDADRLCLTRVDDSVRLDVLTDLPGE